MSTKARKRARAKYDKKTAVYVSLKLNKNTDQEIIERLAGEESKQGYIKRLIRQDMENRGE